ncbi:hypothetical protein [Mucilaginibacter sp. SP1R1]|uniref:hypothetical protein n=1 Tax=Mucilaginibacter sp. SP1R1 TaxID=2723091 RepID=UPI00160CFD2A|nr:hypothetical protein [Mucilaginibacter sp. SP1R1]MBB6152008.1 hypothetical protein [Mucilaginibacter sp. SP1R1]
MKPIFITIKNSLDLIIIPDSEAHLDGHVAITASYSIYRNRHQTGDLLIRRESKLHLEKKNDPDYMGTIFFESPQESLSYIADGSQRLSVFEIQELVEKIINYRNTPSLW